MYRINFCSIHILFLQVRSYVSWYFSFCVSSFSCIYHNKRYAEHNVSLTGVRRLWGDEALEGQAIVCEQWFAPPNNGLLTTFRRLWTLSMLKYCQQFQDTESTFPLYLILFTGGKKNPHKKSSETQIRLIISLLSSHFCYQIWVIRHLLQRQLLRWWYLGQHRVRVRVMIVFLVPGRARIKIRFRVRVGVTFNVHIYHRSNCRRSKCRTFQIWYQEASLFLLKYEPHL